MGFRLFPRSVREYSPPWRDLGIDLSVDQAASNPIFEVFYLDNPHGVIADFSGNPPYEF